MCKKGTSEDYNHGFGNGTVWSDVGYDTNGSENGVYLPGSYAVGGGRGGIRVWYSLDDDPDWEHDYLEVEKLPPAEYSDFLIYGKKGDIAEDNACWHYVSQAMLTARGQFHDRHIDYSEQIVLKALGAIYKKFKTFDVTLGGDCSECKKRKKKIEEQGLPAPYTLVYRLEFTSKKLRGYLTAMPGSWRKNVYTSIWCKKYMEAVLAGGAKRKAAEMFE